MKCPICDKKFKRTDTKFPPFCSERCKLIDLGRWMNEEYAVPGEPASPADLAVAESEEDPER